MKPIAQNCLVAAGLLALVAVLTVGPRPLRAQPWPPFSVPTTPAAQRNALNLVRSQVGWLQNATRTAPRTGDGVGLLWQQFQSLRQAFTDFTATLNARQQSEGANELVELSGGLDIIQEAFTNYQDDVASGRSTYTALSDLGQVLSQAAAVWLQQLNGDASKLQVGW